MNNFRLSTYKGVVKYLSQEEIEKLLSAAPTIEHLLDGRVIDITTKKYYLKKTVVCMKYVKKMEFLYWRIL